MESIRETIVQVMEGLKTKRERRADCDLEARLKKVLTKREWGHIKISNLRKGVLVVNVDSSGWLYKLGLQKEDLLARLNQGENLVKDIRFRLGAVK